MTGSTHVNILKVNGNLVQYTNIKWILNEWGLNQLLCIVWTLIDGALVE